MGLNIKSGDKLNLQGYNNQSMSRQDDMTKSYMNQIAETRGQLNNLDKKNELSKEEKKEKERQLKQEIADLNKQLRQHKIEKQNEAREQKAKELMDSEKTKKVVSLADKEKNLVISDDKSTSDKLLKEKDKNLTKEKDDNTYYTDKRFVEKLVYAQSEKDIKVNLNNIDKRIDNKKSIEKSEISIDKKRGRDTSNRESRIENIELIVKKVPKKDFNSISSDSVMKYHKA